MKMNELMPILDQMAPFDTQLDFDNSGLLIGSKQTEVKGIHVALDCTDAVLDEMEKNGANVLITHHPLIFNAIKHIDPDAYEGRLIARIIKNDWAIVAMHTNLDAAPGGINDVLAAAIGLEQIEGTGFVRVGECSEAMTAAAFGQHLHACLHDSVRIMGDSRRQIRKVAVSSGAGSDGWEEALAAGAQAFVTGEMKHHHALAAAAAGLVCYECGHHATEEPGIFALADALQMNETVVQSNVRVTKSAVGRYEVFARE